MRHSGSGKGNTTGKTTKRVRLTVAYDGTNYHGWQIQNNGITIESELNRCLTDLLREPVEVIGASRTDSGVHALGNIAVFDTTSRMPAEKISYALNQRLPEDIRIQSPNRCRMTGIPADATAARPMNTGSTGHSSPCR